MRAKIVVIHVMIFHTTWCEDRSHVVRSGTSRGSLAHASAHAPRHTPRDVSSVWSGGVCASVRDPTGNGGAPVALFGRVALFLLLRQHIACTHVVSASDSRVSPLPNYVHAKNGGET